MCRHVQWCNTVTLSRPLLAPALQLTPLVTGHQPANISEIRYWYCDIDTDLDVDTLDISTDFIVCRSSGLLQGHTFIFPAAAALYSRFLSHQLHRETFNTDGIYFRSCVEWMYEMFLICQPFDVISAGYSHYKLHWFIITILSTDNCCINFNLLETHQLPPAWQKRFVYL